MSVAVAAASPSLVDEAPAPPPHNQLQLLQSEIDAAVVKIVAVAALAATAASAPSDDAAPAPRPITIPSFCGPEGTRRR